MNLRPFTASMLPPGGGVQGEPVFGHAAGPGVDLVAVVAGLVVHPAAHCLGQMYAVGGGLTVSSFHNAS